MSEATLAKLSLANKKYDNNFQARPQGEFGGLDEPPPHCNLKFHKLTSMYECLISIRLLASQAGQTLIFSICNSAGGSKARARARARGRTEGRGTFFHAPYKLYSYIYTPYKSYIMHYPCSLL